MTTNTWRNLLRKCHKAMSSGEMVTQLVLDAIQQQKLCVLVSKQLMPSLEEYAKTKKTSLDYAVDSDDWDDDSVAASLTNSTSTTITTSPNSTTTDPAQTGLDVIQDRRVVFSLGKPNQPKQPAQPSQPNQPNRPARPNQPANQNDAEYGWCANEAELVVQQDVDWFHTFINAELATIKRYKPYRCVQAKPGQPVWKAVFGSITAATAILSSSPNGAVWNGDDEQTSITYCAHVTQNAKTITVELMVSDELMCTAVLGRKGKLLVLALCRDDQACNLFE